MMLKTAAQQEQLHHDFDEDGCCIHCGFDGAEWHWWKHSTYEGQSRPDARMPRCNRYSFYRRKPNAASPAAPEDAAP